jgi:hypothetical protein
MVPHGAAEPRLGPHAAWGVGRMAHAGDIPHTQSPPWGPYPLFVIWCCVTRESREAERRTARRTPGLGAGGGKQRSY